MFGFCILYFVCRISRGILHTKYNIQNPSNANIPTSRLTGNFSPTIVSSMNAKSASSRVWLVKKFDLAFVCLFIGSEAVHAS